MRIRLASVALIILGTVNLSSAQTPGACDCWVAPDASYTYIDNDNDWIAAFGINNADDGSYGPIALPFIFDLYGQQYTQAWINVNGNVTFDGPYTPFTPAGFPTNQAVMVAPFWEDVDLRPQLPPNPPAPAGVNQVSFKVTPTALYVNWEEVGRYNNNINLLNTFQLIITDGNDPIVSNGANVSFCYQDMQWASGDLAGSGGFFGPGATAGANKGNGIDYMQFGRFDQPGNLYDGPFGNNDGIDWLDFKYLKFTTDSTSANVPPIVASQSVCDTIFNLCAGQSVTLDVQFLAPEPTQLTTANSFAPTLSNYTITSNTPGIFADISTTFTPNAVDTGFHTITFTGTDNGAPVLTTTITIVVQILPQPIIGNGSVDVCENDPAFDLFPFLTGGALPGGTWTDSLGNAHSGIHDPASDIGGDYTYSFSSGGFCPSSGIVTVNLFSPPDAGSDTVMVYCASDPLADLFLVLGGSPVAGGGWTYPNGSAFSGTLDPSTDPTGIYTYTVLGTPPCVSSSAEVDVTIIALPDAGGDATLELCADEPIMDLFTVLTGTPDTAGSWIAPGGGAFSGNFLASTDPLGVYTYIVPGMASCPADSAEVEVDVDALPNAGQDNMLALCTDGAITNLFSLVSPADAGGNWSDPFGSAHSGTLDPALDSSGVYIYLVDGAGECVGRVDTSEVSVTISDVPVVSFVVDSVSSCVPFPVSFGNTTDPIFLDGSCAWTFGDGNGSSDCASTTHIYQNPGSYDVGLTVTTSAGCSSTLVVPALINADPAPSADFFMDPNPTTVENTTILMTALSPVPDQWNWTITGFADLSGSPEIDYTFPQSEGGVYEVCLDVEDQYGCMDTLCQELLVQDPLLVYVPNAFSPSGDEINDYFIPFVSGDDPTAYELYVFDRWGQVVFESKEKGMPWFGAKNNSGDLLPVGVYVYRLITRAIGDTERREFIGHLTLIR